MAIPAPTTHATTHATMHATMLDSEIGTLFARVLDPVFSDPMVRNEFLSRLAHGLARHPSVVFVTGPRNAGHSTLARMISNAFPTSVSACFSGCDFVRRRGGKKRTPFSARKPAAVMMCHHAINNVEDIDGNMVRSLAGGHVVGPGAAPASFLFFGKDQPSLRPCGPEFERAVVRLETTTMFVVPESAHPAGGLQLGHADQRARDRFDRDRRGEQAERAQVVAVDPGIDQYIRSDECVRALRAVVARIVVLPFVPAECPDDVRMLNVPLPPCWTTLRGRPRAAAIAAVDGSTHPVHEHR